MVGLLLYLIVLPIILGIREGIAQPISYIVLILIAIAIFIVAIAISARIGTTQIGLIVDKDNDIFIILTDYNKNSFVDNIFGGKLFSDMFTMEEFPISGRKKITKESGKKAFIPGTFGTRCVKWRNKQKRDECIAALEMAKGKD